MKNFILFFSKSKSFYIGIFFLLHLGLLAQEICDNGLDDDGDGYVDQYDSDCFTDPIPSCIAPALDPDFQIGLSIQGPANTLDVSISPTIGDLDGDGVVEIIAPLGESSQGYITYHVMNSTLQNANINFNLPMNAPVNGTVVQPALADIDKDGTAEVIIVGEDGYVYVFSHTGGDMTTYEFKSDYPTFNFGSPRIADIDQDGIPEVVVGNDVFQFDLVAKTLIRKVSIPNTLPYGRDSANWGTDVVVVDILPSNPGKEIVAGSLIYGVDMVSGTYSILKNLNTIDPTVPLYADGPTAVGDLDLDGDLDIAFATAENFYVWDPLDNRLLLTVTTPDLRRSIPTISYVYDDVTNNGMAVDYPEVLIGNTNMIRAFNLQITGNLLWTLPTSDTSGQTGITSFDFNGDGIQELVYNDETQIRIINGNTSSPVNLATFSSGTLTWMEHPVIADVDNDGQAEMIAFSGPPRAATGQGRLNIFEAAGGTTWQPAREVWNQRGYRVVNVNDDLTIPAQESVITNFMPASSSRYRVLNQFNAQLNPVNLLLEPGMVATTDATITSIQGFDKATSELTLEISVVDGTDLPSGTSLSIYDGDPTFTNASILGTYTTPDLIPSGSSDIITITTAPFLGSHIYVVINDNGSVSTPFDLSADFPSTGLVECDYTNNIADFSIESLDPPISGGNQIACDSSEGTPTLTASATLSGEGTLMWYDAAVGGNVISEPTLSTVGEVVYYAEASLGAYSSTRTPVLLRIDPSPEITTIADINSNISFALPSIEGMNLSPNVAFYTEPNGGGTSYAPGDQFTTPGVHTMYVFDQLEVEEHCPITTAVKNEELEFFPVEGNIGSSTIHFMYPGPIDPEFWNGTADQEIRWDHPGHGPQGYDQQIYDGIVGRISMPGLASCTVNEVEITAKVTVTSNGPDTARLYSGQFTLVNLSTDTKVQETRITRDYPAGLTETFTVTATLPASDIIAGNIGVMLAVETQQKESRVSWTLSDFSVSTDFEPTGVSLCSDEETFQITICSVNPPVSGGNQYGCAQTDAIPVLLASASVQDGETLQWFDALEGGSEITTPSLEAVGEITYYAQASSGSCVSERTPVFLKISPAPELDNIGDQTSCESYILPPITGLNLTGNEAYYTETDGGGIKYLPGDEINGVGEQTLYVRDSLEVAETCPVDLQVRTNENELYPIVGHRYSHFIYPGPVNPAFWTGTANQEIIWDYPGHGPTSSNGQLYDGIVGKIAMPGLESCVVDQVELTTSVSFTNNGPDAGAGYSGRILLFNLTSGEVIQSVDIASDFPVGITQDYSVTAQMNSEEILEQGVGVIIAVETQHNIGGVSSMKSWTLSNFTVSSQQAPTSTAICEDETSFTLRIQEDVQPGIISQDQTICAGSIPDPILSDVDGVGSGTLEYIWEQSITDATSGFTVIPGQTDATYAPEALEQTTYFRRIAVSNQYDFDCESVPSNVVRINVNPTIGNNIILNDQSVCTGSMPAEITGSLPTGGAGTYTYLWEESSDGGLTWSVASGISDQVNYQPAIVTGDMQYRRTVLDNTCKSTSEVVRLTMEPTPAGFDDTVNTVDCTGTFTYNLQDNVDNSANGGNGVPAVFSWVAMPNPNVTGAFNGTGSVISHTLINTSTTPQQLTYVVTATSASNNACNTEFSVVVDVPVCASLVIEKTADVNQVDQIGDVINYMMIVTNTGNVTHSNVIVTDPLLGGNLMNPTGDNGNGELEPREVWTYEGTYTTTQTDFENNGNPMLNSGIIENTVSITTDQTPSPQIATHDVSLELSPEIALVKTSEYKGDPTQAMAGDLMTYTFAVTNPGNININSVVVNDPLIGGAISGPLSGDTNGNGILETTETWIYQVDYHITQEQVDNGYVENQATADGVGTNGDPVHDVSGTSTINDDPTITVLPPFAAISLVKTAHFNDENGDTFAQEGETVSYSFTVTNTGYQTLTDIIVTDPKVTVSGGPIVSLAPEESDDSTFTAVYTIQQADIDAGTLENTATVIGKNNANENITDVSGTDTNNDDITTITLPTNPAIEATKISSITDNGDGQNGIDDEVHFTITLENTGNVTLSNVSLTDTFVDALGNSLSLTTPPVFESADQGSVEGTLQVGELATYTATYTIAQQVIDAGGLRNSVLARGDSPDGSQVTDVSDNGDDTDGNTTDDDTTIDFSENPSIEATKIAAVTDNGDGQMGLGDLVNFKITVQNTGNVTLRNVILTDTFEDILGQPLALLTGPAFDQSDQGSIEGMLQVGEIATYNATYTITQQAVDAGGLRNSVLAIGDSPAGTRVTDISDNGNDTDGNTSDDHTVIHFDENPSIEATKIATITDNGDGMTGLGDQVHFTITVENTGNVTLSEVTLMDTFVDALGNPLSLTTEPVFESADQGSSEGTLLVGERATYSATYVIGQQAIDAGGFRNSVLASANSPASTQVSDVSDNGDDTDGNTTDDDTTIEIGENPSIEATKIATITDNGDGVNGIGDQVNFTITLENTGNVTLTSVSLTDTFVDALGNPLGLTSEPVFESADQGSAEGTLQVGEIATYTATYVIGQQTIDAGGLNNSVLAVGDSPVGTRVSDISDNGDDTDGNTTDDHTVIDFDENPSIEATKIATITDNGDGITGIDDQVIFTITLENTGNVSLNNVTLTDTFEDKLGQPLSLTTEPVFESADQGSPEGTLLVGELATYTATYTIAQQVIDAGGLRNSVMASGDSPTGTRVTDVSDNGDDTDGNTTDDSTEIDFTHDPKIALVKTSDVSGAGLVGDVITYTFTATNTGNVRLSGIVVNDAQIGITDLALTPSSLDPGESATATATYVITQADILAGQVSNSALITGDDPHGNTTEDTSGTDLDNDDPTITTVPKNEPKAIDDSAETRLGEPVEIRIVDNDISVGAELVPHTIEVISGPLHGTIRIDDNGIAVYTPSPGSKFIGTDTFTYRLQDSNGIWTQVAEVTITITGLFIPNAMTPNGDGVNDTFEILGIENYSKAILLVYNRWGNEVYRSDSYKNDFSGRGLNEGTYYYVLELTDMQNSTQSYKGWLFIKQ